MRLSLIFFSITILLGCSDKENNSSEIYLGTYRVADRMIPYPYLIKQKKDTLFLFDESGICIDKTTKHSINEAEEISFNEKHFKILDRNDTSLVVFDLQDTVNFRTFKNGQPNPRYAAKFQKLASANKLDLQEIRKELRNAIWKYDVIEDENSNPNQDLDIEQLINFRNDSVSIITNYYYQGLKTISEYEAKAYHIFEIDDIYFLSFQKGIDNPQPIYRITGCNSQKIELVDFSSRDTKSISFNKDSISIDEFMLQVENTPPYSNCYDGYQGEYYYDDVTFSKGNEFIASYVNDNLPKNEIKSGYIIIQFNINCFGNIGDFGLIQMNRKYEKAFFSKEIVSHIINRVSKLSDFPPSESQIEWLNHKDVHAFLMFKLDHGKITDVCP
ncbi:hypothetical protein MATR_12170 [Marivirga tractuosa]|uniref:Lipoprotein n=1 Tax=Marivirga tractuosa (strain ATCC 23168 / DSM 4126 / NBRC 15989 / NCIMB 1408 / VKM B-1430 / H-43) TaxID=643867 RepID=E4TVP1_MARTH|nr:hypothetical protein [Marivirga tractuosa]ADR21154.1 hypothetical protein Ftrac_1159 [Marivirga tractuosa DSM 4126]BDD14392.1 hypothetical protein MATR_12170 [Marivirga tractuosa]